MTKSSSSRLLQSIIISTIITYAGFLIFSFLYTLNVIEPRLVFHHIQPFFSLDPNYIKEFSGLPGEYINFFAKFLIQLYYFPVLGSFIITFLLLSIALLTQYIWKETFKSIPAIFIIPSIILLLFHKNYDYSYGLDLIVFFSLIYLAVIKAVCLGIAPWIRMIIHLVFLQFAFYFSGLLGALTFSFLTSLLEITYYKKNYALLVIPLLIVENIAIILFQEPQMTEYSYTALIGHQLPVFTRTGYILMAFFYLVVVVIHKNQNSLKIKINKSSLPGKIWDYTSSFVPIVLIAVLMMVFSKSLLHNKDKYKVKIDYLAYNGEWYKLLETARNNDLSDRIIKFQVNRALSHTGIMDDDLFRVDQNWGIHALILSEMYNRRCLIPMSDLSYEMGYIKAAGYWALEAETYYPYYPRIMKRLVNTFLLNEDYKSAQKYLNILKHSFVHRKWAKEHEKYLYNKKRVLSNPEYAQKLAFNTDKILYINMKAPDTDLIELLEKNNQNREAFDYLLSYYLLSKRLPEFYKYSRIYLKIYNYKHLPKTFEEAILILYQQQNVDYKVIQKVTTPSLFKKFEEFNTTWLVYKNTPETALSILKNKFENTYWYYYYFIKPGITQKEINTY